MYSQPSTSRNPHPPPPEVRRNTYQHTLSSSSEEMLETQPAHPNGWQQIRRTKRKRLQATLPTVTSPQMETHNRYEMLAEDSIPSVREDSTSSPKITKPPPIFLHGVLNYTEMMKSLTEFVEEEQFFTKSLANNVIKLVCQTPDTYRKIVTHCMERHTCILSHLPIEGRTSIPCGTQTPPSLLRPRRHQTGTSLSGACSEKYRER